MAVCPSGHDSASDDFCDVCGMRIGGAPGTPAPGTPAPGLAAGSSPAATAPPRPDRGYLTQPAAGDPCPRCGTPRTGQFCEACGFNFSGPHFTPASSPPPYQPPPTAFAAPSVPPAPSAESAPSAPPVPSVPPPSSMPSFPYPQATWTVVVGADRAYYERVQALTGPEGAAVTFPSYCAERRFQLVGNQMRIGRRSVSRGLSPEIDLTGPPADPGISRLHAVLIAVPDGSWAVLDPGSANGTLVNGSEIGIGDQVPLQDGDRINLGAWTAITVRRG
jgi:FHA domain